MAYIEKKCEVLEDDLSKSYSFGLGYKTTNENKHKTWGEDTAAINHKKNLLLLVSISGCNGNTKHKRYKLITWH